MHKSTDGGVTWTRTWLGWGNESGVSIDGNDTVHVILAREPEPGHFEFVYRRGANGGGTWTDPEVIGMGNGKSDYNPHAWCSIAADRNSKNIVVAWQDGSSGNFEVYGRRSPNGGKTWQKVENVSGTPMPSHQPEIFIDRDSVAHIVWNEVLIGEPNFDFRVYYRRGPLRGN
jgi:hypothetical protein